MRRYENSNDVRRNFTSTQARPLSDTGTYSRVFIGVAIVLGLALSFAIYFNRIAAIGIVLGLGSLIIFCLRPVLGLYLYFFFSFWERLVILPEFSPATGIGYLLLPAFLYNVFLSRKIKLHRIGQEWPFLAVLSCIALSSIYAVNREMLFGRTFTLIQLMIMYYIIVNLINDEERLHYFLWIILIATVVSAGFSLFQRFQLEGIRVIGVGKNPNYTSATLILGMGAAGILFKKARHVFLKYLIFISGGLLLVSLLFTYSRGGLLAFSAGVIYLLLYQKKKGKALLMAGILLLVIIVFMPAGFKARLAGEGEAQFSRENRIEQVRSGLMMIKDHPWIGVGFKNFEDNYASYVTPVYKYEYRGVHNTYVQLAAEIGLPGLIFFLWIFFNSLQSLQKVRNSPYADEWLRYSSRIISGVFIAYLVTAVFAGMVLQKDFWMILSLGTAMAAIVKGQSIGMDQNREIKSGRNIYV